MLYDKICSERQRLEQEIASLLDQLAKLPEGKLTYSSNGLYTKWYQSDGHHSTYIPQKNHSLTEQLAVKKYLSLKLDELLREKTAIDFYLRHHAENVNSADRLLSDDSPYSKLLTPYFTPTSQKLNDWMKEPYIRNEAHPENCIHKTSSGILVRSKSESLIAMFLHTNKIPFRYECALELGDTTLFPDFTIRHPLTGQTFYWEHFGMMDNPGYCNNTFSKLQLYSSHGILPSIQLITTYETKEHPLDLDIVQNLIQFYFL